ncbi:MAG: hypothetical protein GXY84_01680 [Clostridiales bacterium]|nr:hypothetical protein [Clostridiales bacterium]
MSYLGTYTKTDLRDLDWFEAVNQGALSRQAARFGLELAQLAYDFQLAPWLEAGWTDITLQVDNRLISGVRSGEEVGSWYQSTLNQVLPRLARGLTSVSRPLAEIRLYLQAHNTQETGKAVVLLRREGAGRFAVAIAFMGTGKRPQDWAGNMRFNHEDNFHEGFSKIAAQFMGNAAQIRFPTAAQELGLATLSLQDVLQECCKPNSRFRLVAAGHSQGAAVLQVWAYRQLMAGLERRHLVGFGFASPVVAIHLERDEVLLPLTHFLVSNDLFTRVGLRDHLGTCYMLQADEDLRRLCYGAWQGQPLFEEVLALFDSLRDTRQGLLFCLAYLEALSGRPQKAIGSSLAVFVESAWLESLDKLPAIAEEWTEKLLLLTRRGFRKFYYEASGAQAPRDEVTAMADRISRVMDSYGAVAFSQMIVKALRLTHALVNPEPGLADHAPYSYLVVRAFDQLQKVSEPPETGQAQPAMMADAAPAAFAPPAAAEDQLA